MTERIVGQRGWTQPAMLVLAGAIFAGFGLATDGDSPPWVAWAMFAGAGQPILVVDEEGISSPNHRWGPVPWAEVRSASLRETAFNNDRQVWLSFDVDRPERFGFRRSAHSVLNTAPLGLPPLTLLLTNMAVDQPRLLRFIEERVPLHRA